MHTHLLLPDYHEQLRALDAAVAFVKDFEAACRLVISRVAAILNAPAVLVDTRSGRFRVVCTAGASAADGVLVQMARQAQRLTAETGERVLEGRDGSWTCLSLHDSADGLL